MEWIVNSAKINRISYMLPLYSKQWKTWWTMNRKNTKENRTKDHSSRMRNGFRDFRILGDRITFIPSIVSKAKTMMFYQASKSKKIFKKKKKWCRICIIKLKKQKWCHTNISKFQKKKKNGVILLFPSFKKKKMLFQRQCIFVVVFIFIILVSWYYFQWGDIFQLL